MQVSVSGHVEGGIAIHGSWSVLFASAGDAGEVRVPAEDGQPGESVETPLVHPEERGDPLLQISGECVLAASESRPLSFGGSGVRSGKQRCGNVLSSTLPSPEPSQNPPVTRDIAGPEFEKRHMNAFSLVSFWTDNE